MCIRDSSGLVPFLIDWGDSAHPATSGLPVTPLLEVTATVPEPGAVRPLLSALGTELTVTEGPFAIAFTVQTAQGPVTFG